MTSLQFAIALIAMAVAMSAVMTVAWLIQQRTGNSGWVDTVWTFGLGLVAGAAALAPLHAAAPGSRQIVVAAAIALWALRLGWHIASRTRGIDDDPRYRRLIEGWGAAAGREMFVLLQKQAAVSLPLALSVFVAAQNPVAGLRLQDWIGLLILAFAIAGEAVADLQLKRFKVDPERRGTVCDIGLWRWSRHPNYFFEWLGWLAYPLFAIDFGGGYSIGWLALVGPACIYWLLVHVSGIPPLEQHMLQTRGEAFRAYQRRTPAFFPGPVRATA